MSIDYWQESAVLCPLAPILLAHTDPEQSARVEALLKRLKKATTLQTCLTQAEKIVERGVNLADRRKQVDRAGKKEPMSELTWLARLDDAFSRVWDHLNFDECTAYLNNVKAATEVLVEVIFKIHGIKGGPPSVRCFINEGRGHPYIDESFEFGRLYLDVSSVKPAVRELLTKFAKPEEHEWVTVIA